MRLGCVDGDIDMPCVREAPALAFCDYLIKQPETGGQSKNREDSFTIAWVAARRFPARNEELSNLETMACRLQKERSFALQNLRVSRKPNYLRLLKVVLQHFAPGSTRSVY